MGEPVTMGASAAIGVASSYSKYKQASAQAKLDEATRLANNKEAVRALANTMNTLEDNTDQVHENAISTSIDVQKAAAKARGTALASAGATGTGGSAVDMQIDDVNAEAARTLAKSTLNKERQLSQINYNKASADAQYNSRTDLMPVQKPDMLSYILQGVGTAASSYSAISGILE